MLKAKVNLMTARELLESSSLCAVYCYDGSCRDKVEHCPTIHACNDMRAPYRCRSGFCAKDKDTCRRLYGSVIEDESPTSIVSASCDKGNGEQY